MSADEVRQLLSSRHVHAGELVRLLWDGRTDDGGRAPDGRYRYRITLRHQGRSVKLASSVRLDTTPPRPRGRLPPLRRRRKVDSFAESLRRAKHI